MKKLLLMALMALGTSAFAAEVVPMPDKTGNTEASLSVTVKGVIVENTGLNMVITPTLSAGPGSGLEFDFGDLMKGTDSVTKNGKYTIELMNGGNPVAFVNDPVVKLVGGTAGATDSIKDVETLNATGQSLAKIHYENSVLKSGLMYEGTLAVSASPKDAIGTGTFMTNAVGVSIVAANQDTNGNIIQ